MKFPTTYLHLVILITFLSCQQSELHYFEPVNQQIRTAGRVDMLHSGPVVLIGAASSVSFSFTGDSCQVGLLAGPNGSKYNFVSLELDGEYVDRYRIEGDSVQWLTIKAEASAESHQVSLYKATEASVGDVEFVGVKAEKLLDLPEQPNLKIEFIGNSITCGMGVDTNEIPCGSGEWFDQHNAYWAYGPRLARELNARFVLSSVSGIGIYRTWNMEEPSMPAVYENRYLNTDSTKRWDFEQFQPDIVSIALGTNDFSEGDSLHARPPFSADTFVSKYICFIEKIYSHYPNTQIALLSSPIFDETKTTLMMQCLKKIQEHFNNQNPAKPIRIYEFHDIVGHGCTGHPDREDQRQMAEQLLPFFKSMINE